MPIAAGQQNEPSLRDTIASAMDAPDTSSTSAPSATSTPAAAAPATPTAQTTPTLPGAGDAAPNTSAAAPVAPAAGVDPAKAAIAPAGAAGTPGAAPVEPKVQPPVGFPDVRDWEKIPANVQKWVRGREVEFNKGLQRNAEAAKFGTTMWQQLAPYEATIKATGANPFQLVSEMAATHHLLTSGSPQQREEAFVRAAARYGIDLNAVAERHAGRGQAATPSNPEVAELRKTVGTLMQHLRGQEQFAGQQVAQQVWQDVDKFATNPQNEHLPILWPRMAELLEGGIAKSLEDAYEQALWTRPDLRAIRIEQDAARRASEAQNQRNAATGGPGVPVAAGAVPSNESLRSTLERAWDKAA